MNAPLDDLLVGDGLRLCWLGNLSWLLGDGRRLLAFDLDLETDTRVQPSPIPTAELAPHLDVHFITHGHGDHFSNSTCPILVERSECLFVLPANCLDKARDLGIPDERVRVARPDEPLDLEIGLHVEPQRALHGDKAFAVYRLANLDDCGYLFDFGGKRALPPRLRERFHKLVQGDVFRVE